jgi:hypothetical protein
VKFHELLSNTTKSRLLSAECLFRENELEESQEETKKKKPIGEKMQMPTNKKKLISSNNQ